jgi:hypothetical protein
MESSANGHEHSDAEAEAHEEEPALKNCIDYVPQYRLSYPGWVTIVLGSVLATVALYVAHLLLLSPLAQLILVLAAVGLAFLWRSDSNRTLRGRVPPPGWKQVIKPDNLEKMEPADFDELMRFELQGDDDDDVENHRVRWASRYSDDVIFISKLLLVLAFLCLLGAAFVRHITVTVSSTELPQTYRLTFWWLLASAVLSAIVVAIRFDWHYRRLMFDESQLYILKENPAWLPWNLGQNDPILLMDIISADPVDTGWGKRWGHGTVILKYQDGLGGGVLRKRLRRVPKHRTFCNALNGMRANLGMFPYGSMGMGMRF